MQNLSFKLSVHTGFAKKTVDSKRAIILAASKKFNLCEVQKDRGLEEPND